MNATPIQTRLPLIGFMAAVFCKYWLIWESEISDAFDDPHEYVLQILHPANGGLAYGPGTGLAGRLFADLGIPFRLGIETFFILASILVLRAFFAWPWKSRLSLVLFLFITFDPALVELFSHLFSDQVWLVETMAGLSCLVLALENESRPNWILLNLSALLLGLATLTRSVFIPLMLGLGLFTILGLALAFLKQQRAGRGTGPGVLALSMLTLFLIINFIYQGTCWYNLRCYGFSGISAIDCNEFKKFYFCLQSVGDPTGLKYYPVDESRRQLIAQAGPASNRLMSGMNRNEYLKQVSLEHYGTSDLAAAWLHFAIFNEAYQSGGDGDLRKCYALFETVENEIEEAHRRGVLKVRPIVPLPDSRISIVAGAYPGALWEIVGEIAHETAASALVWSDQSRYENPDFTAALHRRLIHESPIRDGIWRLLSVVYGCLYAPVIAYLIVAAGAGLAVVIMQRKHIEVPSFADMARHLFTLFFVIFIAWYALFAASGWPALSRYMIYNHVMLPILLAYYLPTAWRLLRAKPDFL